MGKTGAQQGEMRLYYGTWRYQIVPCEVDDAVTRVPRCELQLDGLPDIDNSKQSNSVIHMLVTLLLC